MFRVLVILSVTLAILSGHRSSAASSNSGKASFQTSSSTLSTSKSATTSLLSSQSSSEIISELTNPVLFEDFPDNDVFLGPDNAFYLSASSFHFSPGAPILRSYDLINWEFIGHSVPTLDFGDAYSMIGGTAYRRGIWASTLRHRKSNGLWYWYGCIDFYNSFVYTAPSVTGPWSQAAMFSGQCFYDCGLLIDDDDTMYIVYTSGNVHIAQLSQDGLSVTKTQEVIVPPAAYNYLEGNRIYKRNGTYYVLDDNPGVATLIWQSTSLWGPWTWKALGVNVGSPAGLGGTVVQGSLLETPAGDWFFMSFSWNYPLGRMPVIAPIAWGSDGFPVLNAPSNNFADSYPNPLQTRPLSFPWLGTDTFSGTSLSPSWEWNHNPDPTKFSVNNSITLSSATITNDLFQARNTLCHRIQGPLSTATVELDFGNMADGDSAGLAAFRDWTAYIGIKRSGSVFTISNVQGVLQNQTTYATISDGTVAASASISKGKVWLKGTMETLNTGPHNVSFQYSTDGHIFNALGSSYTLTTDYNLFIGYRWGIFNYATKALGGSVLLSSFTQA